MSSKNVNVRRLTTASVMAALTVIFTLLIRIPTPTKGYINLGDSAVNIAAWLIGGVYGAAAAGIGSAAADIISGYPVYAPATLAIKVTMAIVSGIIFSKLSKNRTNALPAAAAAAASEIIMIAGYALYEGFLYNSFATALLGIPGNIVQGISCAFSAVLIYEILFKKIKYFKNGGNHHE